MTRGPTIITIDGAAGSGKSTLGKALAAALSLPYINTGLMYRHLTREALAATVDSGDGADLAALLGGMEFSLSDGDPPELLIDGRVPSRDLQGRAVEAEVSHVARHPEVRALMRARQRALGSRTGAVMEGRDIGSVVFPEAPLKLYLSAHPVDRAARRTDERSLTSEEVAASLHRRDRKDATVTPFEPPPGSVILDTTDLDITETLAAALGLVRQYVPGVGS
ncbi:MAG: (d)CMP kinase [Actinomycetota bacterium]